jgi:site-specific recombinase XerD
MSDETDHLMGSAIRDYLAYILGERNYSQHTGRAYGADLHQFAEKIEEQWGEPPKLAHLTRMQVRSFAAWLMESGRKPKTISRKLASIRSFQQFLLRRGLVNEQDWTRVAPRQQQKTLPTVLDEQQMNRLMTLPRNDEPMGVRDRAIMEVLYSSGLRVSELVALDLADLDITEALVKVRGKGNKERIVPVGRIALGCIDRYIREFRMEFVHPNDRRDPPDAIFLSRLGRRISVERVRKVVTGYLRQVSNEEHLGPHLLRHACATHLVNHGANLRDVQEMLGHASVTSTQIYVSVAATRLTEIYRKSHPRSQ